MMQQPASTGWPPFHCVCFADAGVVFSQLGIGIWRYISTSFPILILNSFWFVAVFVVAMWIYCRESRASLKRQGGGNNFCLDGASSFV